jgi:hypothetical protein
MDARDLALAIIGLLQGGLVYPSMLLGQRVARRFAPKGAWVYMVIAMAVWAVSMIAIAVVANQFVTVETRRALMFVWVSGFVVGLLLAGFLLGKRARA